MENTDRADMQTEEKLSVLSGIAERLNDAGITWGVGASLLLYFKGIVNEFHDIDIMVTEKDADRLKSALSEMGELQPLNPNAQYRTKRFYEFVIRGVDVDVMAGFVIVKDGEEYDASFTGESICEYIEVKGQRIPLGFVSDWRRFYDLMGRESKVRMIDDAFRSGALKER